MDEADYAQERIDRELARAIAAARGSGDGPDRADCEECGADIGEPRRKALPGVRHCIGCAEFFERTGR